MAKWGMVIDLDKCTACKTCVVACREENNIPFVGKEEADMGRAFFWMEIIPIIEEEFPKTKIHYLPRPCMQCENPPCVRVCPVGATYKNPEGIIGQVYYRCIGCRYCTTACPYTARFFNWYPYSRNWPEEYKKSINPEVSIRPRGCTEKCSFCYHRILAGKKKAKEEGREPADGEITTACAEACPSGAIYFGDLNDPKSMVSTLAGSRRAFKLEGHLGTEPKVIYLREGEWDDSTR